MKNQKKITNKEVAKAIRQLLRKNIVGLSRMNKDGEITFRFPNGQSFVIFIKECIII